MNVDDFFENREIFITGGTGYLGKGLIEKLLRDFSNIKTIYVLLRGKKSLTVEQRLEELKKDKVFERLKKECPEVLSKLHAIQGDSKELGLGIKPQDLDLLKNVSIIFHNAANVRFDDPFRSSILLNSRGTLELLKIAENLKNLLAFVHCSTAYCNPFNDVIDEKVYDMPVDWRTTIKMAETYDEYTLDTLFPKYSGHYPNTYTFTKNTSEQIVKEYSNRLPVVIFRPSVVSTAYKEPVPGWIDNLNGALAGTTAVSVGVMPLIYARGDISLDCVPIDMVTKLTIVAAYRRGVQFLRKEIIHSNPVVINCASNDEFGLGIDDYINFFMKSSRKYPLENTVWHFSSPWTTSSYFWFLTCIFVMNIPLALLIDTILLLMGRKPLMIKISRRIVYSTKAICFFSFKDYVITNNNIWELENFLNESDFKKLGFLKECTENLNFDQYFDDAQQGVKYYLFNQNPKPSVGLLKRYKAMIIINETIKFLLYGLCLRYLWLYLAN